jgi:SH3 domain protein
LLSAAGHAQDVRYVSDKQYIPLRSGAGSDYRIIHRGIPSGTRLTVARTSSDGEWAEITTQRGTTGWIRTQYLMKDMPAQNKLEAAQQQAAQATEKSGSQLGNVTEELTQLKQISANAVQLDIDNRRLVEESENLRSEVEMLKAEKQRLQDKLQSEDFINGALAVLLGVIITLVVPRVWPKRRKSSSWA